MIESTTDWRHRYIRSVLGISTILMGACGIVYEYTLGALGNNLMGSSHEQIFVVIGLMLFAMGIGSVLQRRLTNALIDKFLFLELLLGLLGGVSVLVIYITFVYSTAHHMVMYAFAVAIGICIGLEIPLLIRISNEFALNLKDSLSDILSLDYMGALVGALLFTYVLLTRVTMERITLLLGSINVIIGLLGLLYFWPMVKRKYALMGLGSAILVLLTGAFAVSPAWMGALEQRCYRDPIIYRKTSPYQHIVLTKRGDRLNLHINGHLQFSSVDERIYHELLVHTPMSVAASRERVLILGGGDGLALREVLKYPSSKTVTLVDLDPMITKLAAHHPEMIRINEGAFYDSRVETPSTDGLTTGEEQQILAPAIRERMTRKTQVPIATVNVLNIDADLFLRSIVGPFDVVLIDFPDPSSVELAKLYSVDFFKQLALSLSKNAVIAIQSTSPFHAREVYLCIGRTLMEAGYRVLPYHENVPSFGEWGFYLAWQGGPTPRERLTSIRQNHRLSVDTSFLTPRLLSAAFEFGKGWISFDHVRFNTKMRPAILDYFRKGWQG